VHIDRLSGCVPDNWVTTGMPFMGRVLAIAFAEGHHYWVRPCILRVLRAAFWVHSCISFVRRDAVFPVRPWI
jgi:hypothetical protein